ncbi:MAG: hypothetical protein WBP81_17645 [Solirubrobacteraceae bacterium]
MRTGSLERPTLTLRLPAPAPQGELDLVERDRLIARAKALAWFSLAYMTVEGAIRDGTRLHRADPEAHRPERRAAAGKAVLLPASSRTGRKSPSTTAIRPHRRRAHASRRQALAAVGALGRAPLRQVRRVGRDEHRQ